jgi:hypothetical protein
MFVFQIVVIVFYDFGLKGMRDMIEIILLNFNIWSFYFLEFYFEYPSI